MRLFGQLTEEFQAALMDAFTKESLAQMVSMKLNERLEDIVPDGNMKSITFELIQEFAKQDRVLDLAEAALKANPNNRLLIAFVEKIKTSEISSQALSVSSEKGDNLSPIDRLKLMRTLNSLLPQQLEELVVSVKPPGSVIPPAIAAQGDRTADLISWAESPGGVGLQTIQEFLPIIIDEKNKSEHTKRFCFFQLLDLIKKNEKLKEVMPQLLLQSGLTIKSEFINIINNSGELAKELILKNLHCVFLQCLYTFIRNDEKNNSANQEAYYINQELIEEIDKIAKNFEECNIKEHSGVFISRNMPDIHLHIYIKDEGSFLQVSAKVCPDYEDIAYEPGKHINEDSSISLKNRIELFIEAATKEYSDINKIELFLPVSHLNEKIHRLVDERYLRTYVVTICITEYLNSNSSKIKGLENNLDRFNKNFSFKYLFDNDSSALEKVEEADILECTTDYLNTKDFLKKVALGAGSHVPIGIKIKPQRCLTKDKSEGIPIDNKILEKLVKNDIYIPIILWSTWEPSDLKDDKSQFEKLLNRNGEYSLNSWLQDIRDTRADMYLLMDEEEEIEDYLGYHLNILYTDLKGLHNLLKGIQPLNDQIFKIRN